MSYAYQTCAMKLLKIFFYMNYTTYNNMATHDMVDACQPYYYLITLLLPYYYLIYLKKVGRHN